MAGRSKFPTPSKVRIQRAKEALRTERAEAMAVAAARTAVREATEGHAVCRRHIDAYAMKFLGGMAVSQRDAAHYLGISREQLLYELRKRPDLQGAYNQGLAETKLSLQKKQVEMAQEGNVQMLIWMGKQLLEQSEHPVRTEEGWEVGGEETITVTMNPDLRERIAAARQGASPEARALLEGRHERSGTPRSGASGREIDPEVEAT